MGTYEFILIGAIILVSIVLEFLRDRRYWKRIDNMLDRFMAMNSPESYRDYQYYDKQYERDLDNAQEQIDAHIEKIKKEPKPLAEEIPFEDLEEDWSPEEFQEAILSEKIG